MNNRTHNRLSFWLIIATAVLFIAVVITDVLTPLGLAMGVLYVLPVALSLWLPQRRITLIIGSLSVLLVIAALFFKSPSSAPLLFVLVNRGISVLAIALLMIIGTFSRAADYFSLLLQKRTADEALKEAEARYRSLVRLGGETGEAIVMMQDSGKREGVHIFCNETWSRLTNYAEDELLNMSFFDLVQPEQRERCLETYRRKMKGRDGSELFEMNIVKKDGGLVPVELTCGRTNYRLKPANVAYIRDITERKRLEERLLFLASFPELNPNPILELDQQGNITYLNPTARDLFPDLPALGVKHPFLADWEDIVADLHSAGGAGSISREISVGDKCLEQIIQLAKSMVDGARIRIYCRDVTRRNQAEQALRDSEERYRALVQLGADVGEAVIVLQDTDDGEGIQTFVSDPWLKITGYSRGELLGKSFFQIVAPQYREASLERHRKKIIGQAMPGLFELSIVRKDGNEVPIELTSAYSVYGGKPANVMYVRDITERRQAEDTLRKSEQRYQSLFNSIPDACCWAEIILDKDGNPYDFRILQANEAWGKLHGLDFREVIGKTRKEILPVSEPFWIETYGRVALTGEPASFERYSTVNGKWVRASVYSPARGEFVQVINDITENKRLDEELRLRAQLLDAATDLIHISDMKGKILYVNEAFCLKLGYTREELLGHNIREFVSATSFSQRPDNPAEAEGVNQVREAALVHKDGSLMSAEVHYKGINWGGQMVFMDIVRDITERKRLDEELMLRAQLLDAATDLIHIIDMNGKILYVNEASCRKLGYAREELLGHYIREFITTTSFHRQSPENLAAAESINEVREVTHICKNGSLMPVEVHYQVINWGGQMVFMDIVRDITERKKFEERLMMNDRMASIGQLASGIAHELNNPLTGVIGFSELLMDRVGDVPGHIREDLTTINREAKRAAGVIRGLLTFARGQKMGKELTDVNKSLEEMLQLRAYEHRVNNIEVKTNLAENLPPVLGNRGQLQQVFINIIINAEQAMLSAHRKGVLTVTTEQVGDAMRISFADDGPGISPENMRLLFTPFFTTKEVGKGTGLGLSICHGIITEHGGKIWAESEFGKGAAFFIELPAASAQGRQE